jgi:hypothetical protein
MLTTIIFCSLATFSPFNLVSEFPPFIKDPPFWRMGVFVKRKKKAKSTKTHHESIKIQI